MSDARIEMGSKGAGVWAPGVVIRMLQQVVPSAVVTVQNWTHKGELTLGMVKKWNKKGHSVIALRGGKVGAVADLVSKAQGEVAVVTIEEWRDRDQQKEWHQWCGGTDGMEYRLAGMGYDLSVMCTAKGLEAGRVRARLKAMVQVHQ